MTTRSPTPSSAIVAEQTGYPPDLLDLDLDLEADLGVDTVKQAEVFAAVRGHYGIERDDDLKLRDYPTLDPRHRLDPRQDRQPPRPPPAPQPPAAGRARPAPAAAPAPAPWRPVER